jgi:hypothetical protein
MTKEAVYEKKIMVSSHVENGDDDDDLELFLLAHSSKRREIFHPTHNGMSVTSYRMTFMSIKAFTETHLCPLSSLC